jgi:uncharacterized membrane protein YkoI
MLRGRMIMILAIAIVLAAAGTAYAGLTGDGTPAGSIDKPTTTLSTVVSPSEAAEHATETALEGDTLDKVVAAAVAKVGADATVVRAETDADDHAVYEVHMVLADGTLVTVYVDESFNVIGVETEAAKPDTDTDDASDDDSAPWGEQRDDETLLTGDVLTQVVAAAVAKVGADATVVRAETDADDHAVYEVHMVLADGTAVIVYVDESYSVVSVEQRESEGTCGEDNAEQPWGERRTDETLLEGDVLAQVVAAATAQVGTDATVVRAETDADGNAAYEVHMVLADGRLVTVYVNESYAVVSVAEKQGGGRYGEMKQDGERQRDAQDQRTQLRDEQRTRDRERDQTKTTDETQATEQTHTTTQYQEHDDSHTGTDGGEGNRSGDGHGGSGSSH